MCFILPPLEQERVKERLPTMSESKMPRSSSRTRPVAVGAPMIELDACAVLALGNEITNVTLSPTNYRSSAFPVSFTRVSEGLGGVTRPQRRPVHSLALSSRSI